MTDFEPEVRAQLQHMLGKIHKEIPELAAIMDSAKEKGLSETEAMRMVMERMGKNPKMQKRFTALAMNSLAPLRAPPTRDDLGGAEFQAGVGLPQMNPLLEARLAERLQFDGDIPELRQGPLLPGVPAAVAVRTDAVNPVAIGQMLAEGSRVVTEATQRHEAARKRALERIASQKEQALMARGTDGMVKSDPRVDELTRGSASTDLQGYRRGEVPAPVEVPAPSGSALARMSKKDRQDHAWRFLSTTQGRSTASEVIREIMHTSMASKGWNIAKRTFDPDNKLKPVAAHKWEVSLGGRGAIQPAFNFIETAAKAMESRLLKTLEGGNRDTLRFLEVIPINDLDVRSVGWAARLMEG